MSDSIKDLKLLWSSTEFINSELSEYAHEYMINETRKGIMAMAIILMIIQASAAALYMILGYESTYFYTYGLLSILSLHVTISTKTINDIKTLNLLGITMLVVSGSALLLLAHENSSFGIILMTSLVLLFMVIPMAPWGLRESVAVITILYFIFTISTVSVKTRFDPEILMILQYLMLGAGMITLASVGRNVFVRKHDITMRFRLEKAHKQVEILSLKDPLTGAWNRRYLENSFSDIIDRYKSVSKPVSLALLDIDDFKIINDTYGHDYGDKILQCLANSFFAYLEEDACFIRLGGDEFAAILSSKTPEEVMLNGICSMQNCIHRFDPDMERVSASIGIVTMDTAEIPTYEELYKQTDRVLYIAKERKQSDNLKDHIIHQVLHNDPVKDAL